MRKLVLIIMFITLNIYTIGNSPGEGLIIEYRKNERGVSKLLFLFAYIISKDKF